MRQVLFVFASCLSLTVAGAATFDPVGVQYDLYCVAQGAALSDPNCTGTPTSFTVLDKTFSGITANIVSFGGLYNPQAPFGFGDLSLQFGTVDGNAGLRVGGLIQAKATATVPSSIIDVNFGYTVTAPAALIKDLYMGFNGQCVFNNAIGDCGTTITETVTDGNTVVAQVVVTNPPPNSNLIVHVDPLDGAPYRSLNVQKDIAVTASWTGAAGTGLNSYVQGSISFIDQAWSQVPEPGFYGLLACGMSGLLFFARRRRSAL
jgi:hypothetical protein